MISDRTDMPSFFVTGASGLGKTTVVLKVIDALKMRKYSVGGMISKEVREEGERVGFEIVDLASGRTGWLAHIERESGPRIGRYRVDSEDLEEVGVKSLLNALGSSDVVVCDEVGPMELTSERFREAVDKIVHSSTPVLGTLHQKYASDLIPELRDAEDLHIFRLTARNRDALPYLLSRRISALLSR